MPVNASTVGLATEPLVHEVDARWTMAYSAALGDVQPCYMDTSAEEGVVAHPLFPICPEWPVLLELRDLLMYEGLTEHEALRGVHATHDTHVHRLVRPGDRLYTFATIISVEARSAGAFVRIRLDTNDENGQPVSTTFQGSLYRQVEVDGESLPPIDDLPTPPSRLEPNARPYARGDVSVPANASHTYTECARIWNPIHTDAAVAKRSGLPDIILHGSATLALAVSQIVEHEAEDDPRAVRRIAGSFRGMVFMPSDIEVRLFHGRRSGDTKEIRFDVLNVDGRAAIADGLVEIRPYEEELGDWR